MLTPAAPERGRYIKQHTATEHTVTADRNFGPELRTSKLVDLWIQKAAILRRLWLKASNF